MQRFCFISNYHLTPVFLAIAATLRLRGIESIWIVVNEARRREILEAGWSADEVLYLPLPENAEFVQFDEFPVKFFDLIFADRALRHTPQLGLAYLNTAASKILRFLRASPVNFVIGEPTWAHERLAVQLCKNLPQTTFLSPHTTRFPSARWTFFEGEDQSRIGAPADYSERTTHNTTLNLESLQRHLVPAYVKKQDELLARAQTVRARLNRLVRFFSRVSIDAADPTFVHSRLSALRVAGAEELHRLTYRLAPRTPVTPEILDRQFVVYALHKQPESSIDVYGRYYEDQEKLIEAIWRTLPSGWWLYIKEHSNAIGDRSLCFYRRLSRLPNVLFIHENTPAHVLIAACRAVFTVSGTIAYEAALNGKTSFTFAPMFFNELPTCSRIGLDDLRNSNDLEELISAAPRDVSVQKAFDKIHAHSFEGLYSDSNFDPSVLVPDNVRKLAAGFFALCRDRI